MNIHVGDLVRYRIGAGTLIYIGTVTRLPLYSAGYYLILPSGTPPSAPALSYDYAYLSEIIEAVFSPSDAIKEFLS